MKFGRKVKITKERALLDESRLNGRKVNSASSGFLLEAEGGLSRIEKCKANPDIPLYLTGVVQTGDNPNRNGRIYPWEYLKRECIRYMDNEVKDGLSYGECFAEGHKILTKEGGWVDFNNLKGSEFVATMNQTTKEFEWQQPIRKVEYEYDGDMVKLDSKSFCTLVTPEHKFFVTYNTDKTKFNRVFAKDLNSSHLVPKKCGWKGEWKEEVVIENENGKFSLETKKFSTLLAWYLSEGWFSYNKSSGNYSISVSQTKSEGVFLLKELFHSLKEKGFTVREDVNKKNEHTFVLVNKVLALYCKQFAYSKGKYIPQEIKTLDVENIKKFLEIYLLADGTGRDFYTSSKKMSEDLSELLHKAGYSSTITEKEQYRTFYTLLNKQTNEKEVIDNIYWYTKEKYKKNKHLYEIIDSKREYTGEIFYIIRKRISDFAHVANLKKETVQYKGKVYCVEVPNQTILVMNEGKTFWSSNCDHPEDSATPSLTNAALIIEDLSFKGKDVVAKIRVLNAFMPDSAPGKKIRGFLLNGKNVGVSSRALGSLEQYTGTEYDVVAEDMEVVCWDFVSNASNFGSEKLNLVEANGSSLFPHKRSKLLFESGLKNIKMLTESEKTYLEILGLERFIKARNILE